MSDFDNVLNIEKKTINNKQYSIRLLQASTGFTLAMSIVKLLAPAVGSSIDGLRQDDVFTEPKTFHDTALSLITQMDKVDVLEMIKFMLDGATVDSNSLDFETHFTANYGELIQVVEFALEANFSSFFMDQGLRTRLTEFLASLINKEETSEQLSEE